MLIKIVQFENSSIFLVSHGEISGPKIMGEGLVVLGWDLVQPAMIRED
jgi:hypothetical protein